MSNIEEMLKLEEKLFKEKLIKELSGRDYSAVKKAFDIFKRIVEKELKKGIALRYTAHDEEEDIFYIRLKTLGLEGLEDEEEQENYYNDRLYLKEVKGMDDDEIDEILQ